MSTKVSVEPVAGSAPATNLLSTARSGRSRPALYPAKPWQRMAAQGVDFLVLMPVWVLYAFLISLNQRFVFWFDVSMIFLLSSYSAVFQASFGRTLGKAMLGLRVTDSDGKIPSSPATFKRLLADGTLSVSLLAFSALVAFAGQKAGWVAGSWLEPLNALFMEFPWLLLWTLLPALHLAVVLGQVVEADEGRTFADRIAGTKVVRDR